MKYTSNNNMLYSLLNSEENTNVLIKRLIKKINGCIPIASRKS